MLFRCKSCPDLLPFFWSSFTDTINCDPGWWVAIWTFWWLWSKFSRYQFCVECPVSGVAFARQCSLTQDEGSQIVWMNSNLSNISFAGLLLLDRVQRLPCPNLSLLPGHSYSKWRGRKLFRDWPGKCIFTPEMSAVLITNANDSLLNFVNMCLENCLFVAEFESTH